MIVRPVMWMAVACATAGACVKVPPFQYQDGGGTDMGDASDGGDGGGGAGLNPTLTTVNGKYIVTGTGLYRMEFAQTGFHYPSVLDIGGAQLVGATTAGSCNSEEGVGSSLYPVAVFNAETLAGTASSSSTISAMISGPGLVKVALDWAVSMSVCPGTLTGRTTFTFLPDGRIIRQDRLQSSVGYSFSCQCGSGAANWEMTGFFAVAGLPGQTPVGLSSTPANGSSVSVTTSVCFTGTNPSPYALAFSFPDFHGRVRKVNTTLVAIDDLIIGNTASTLPAQLAFGTTVMWPDRSTDCTALRGKVENLVPDWQLMVDGVGIGVAGDGIYGGETGLTPMQGGFSPTNDTFTVQNPSMTAALGPFALWLNMGPGKTVKSATRTYVPYSVDNQPTQQVLWFPDGLGANESFQITVGYP